jgi:hypothetical protein
VGLGIGNGFLLNISQLMTRLSGGGGSKKGMNNPYEKRWRFVMCELERSVLCFGEWLYKFDTRLRLVRQKDGFWTYNYGDWTIDNEREWHKKRNEYLKGLEP